MTIAYLASFLRVSPFRKTHDFIVHVKLDVLYRDAMEKLGEVNDEDCMKFVVRKMLAWYTKNPPKNDEAAASSSRLSKPALLFRAPPTAPPRQLMGPARNVA
jgi:hypothetical protein